jgi:hypothetical protein
VESFPKHSLVAISHPFFALIIIFLSGFGKTLTFVGKKSVGSGKEVAQPLVTVLYIITVNWITPIVYL